ncbi:MAG TPA: hybrid sensor histidine kinase/response regulator [Desulfuromonadales bacterium]|nr:hybrid sensor histidine kinase/response regulator [Desulfuromonadales bacterium]
MSCPQSNPRRPDRSGAGQGPAAPRSAETGRQTILIVEDEPEILAPLAHSLEIEGYRILTAEDGLTACRLIGTEEPDLILLDILLPDLDGWEVCRLLRQHPISRIATIPVIMLTALNSPGDKWRGLELGADHFLPKPYSIKEVSLTAANLICRRRHSVALEKRVEQLTTRQDEQENLTHLLFHELRNQITILNGYSQLLNENGEIEVCKHAINRSSAYLHALAEEVLLIRQVEGGLLTLAPEPVVIKEVLEEMVRLYAQPAADRNMIIESAWQGETRPVVLNRPGVKIILSSLLDNAIKYGPPEQTVMVSGRQTDNLVELDVQDQGEVIPHQEQEQIFMPFYRSGGPTGRAPGTGLGLHGVRVLSRAMGGQVSLDEPSRGGNLFRVRLFGAERKEGDFAR